MEDRTPVEIVELPLSRKEEEHRSRTRRAFNVFVSRYVLEFWELNPHEQHEKVWNLLEERADNPTNALPYYSDEDSTDSIVERRDESVKYKFVFRCACSKMERAIRCYKECVESEDYQFKWQVPMWGLH